MTQLSPIRSVLCSLLMGLLCPRSIEAAEALIHPLRIAHAHNDYEHSHPLVDALSLGFCSVEADIHLVDGQLLVGHDASDLKSDRTLQRLYLDPLAQRVKQNGGSVYGSTNEFILLIDIKTDAEPTYTALRKELRHRRRLLTEFTPDSVNRRAITVILSGNRPIETVRSEKRRWCGIDGRMSDFAQNPAPSLMPLISDNWSDHFSWRGVGVLPESDRILLQRTVATAHQQGRRLRFWGTGNDPVGWVVLRDAGVDLIGADDLEALSRFLNPK